MAEKKKGIWKYIPDGIPCLVIVFGLFAFIGMQMGVPQMLNTIMKTAHDLLLNTCFYLMAICVITGAIGKIFVEFGVVKLLERLLRPLMRPLFNLPGVASLGAVMTFLSDNPAIISLSQDKRFSSYFKKYQYISLTNFGTAFGMGLLVLVFMVGQGFYAEPFIGLVSAFSTCTSLGTFSLTGEKFQMPRMPASTSMSAQDCAQFFGTVSTARRMFMRLTSLGISETFRTGTPCSLLPIFAGFESKATTKSKLCSRKPS